RRAAGAPPRRLRRAAGDGPALLPRGGRASPPRRHRRARPRVRRRAGRRARRRPPPHRRGPVTTDPRLDLAVGVLELHGGRVRFVHPREPTALLDDEDVAADQAYPPYWAEVWESGVELAHAVST